MTVAGLLYYMIDSAKKKWNFTLWITIGVFLLIFHVTNVANVVNYREDYQSSISELKQNNANIKVLSTQHLIHKMYVSNRKRVLEVPKRLGMLGGLYQAGVSIYDY